jgi:hypothetical protein
MTSEFRPQHWAWSRLTFIAVLFALGAGASFLNWQRHPPTPRLAGGSINMRNVPGDLTTVLWFYAAEFIIASAALQPWLRRPHRRIMGTAGILFAAWGVLRWMAGLHSPPVMFAHDVLMLIVALVLCASTLAYST